MKYLFSVIAVLALLTSAALAQTVSPAAKTWTLSPYVTGGVSFSGTTSITDSNHSYQVGAGVETNTKKYLFDINGNFDSGNPSNVFKNAGGYTGTISGSAYRRLFGKVLLGGGAYWSNQVASGQRLNLAYLSNSFNYLQVRPFVGAGYEFKRDTVIVSYVLPGVDQVNVGTVSGVKAYLYTGVDSRIVRFNNEYTMGTKGVLKHVRFTQNLSVNSSNMPSTIASVMPSLRASSFAGGVGVKFVF